MNIKEFLNSKHFGAYGAKPYGTAEPTLKSFSPIDNCLLASVPVASSSDYENVISDLQKTFLTWRSHPAPKRGLIMREIGEELRRTKNDLAELVSLEVGKSLEQAKGEVQEAIDIIDYAVGLSRQLYGNTMKSERPGHRMMEQWHPLGIVGVITAFNFPVAVWSWNAIIAGVCGNVMLWKPSEIAPLTSIALSTIANKITSQHGFPAVFGLIIGDGPELGKRLAADSRVALVSATGSCEMGKSVAETVGKRLGRTLLELGGNNAIIVMDDADLKLAVPGIVFSAVATAGQRCTSARRILVQKNIREELEARLIKAYQQIRVGNPLDPKTLVGPLINKNAVKNYLNTISLSDSQGGKLLTGGKVLSNMPSDLYVQPTLIAGHKSMSIIQEETFAPIAYIIEFADWSEAIELHNSVRQGLSSAIFTSNLKSAELFLAEAGSDCGIANVNIGTSGAEIGGAFGGEKETGGGRESGSDSWKNYMRRQTNTINFSDDLPLAQGIKFEI